MRATVDGFGAYLVGLSLSGDTVSKYQRHAAVAARTAGGWVARLQSRDLAPKTKRLARAAGRHWADYTEDSQLREQLKRMRLPAPRRVAAKQPLEEADLYRVMDQIDRAPWIDDALRAVIGLMTYRGLRCGDVLRMRREEVSRALSKSALAFEGKGARRLEFKVLRTYQRWLEVLVKLPRWDRIEDLISHGRADARRRSAGRRVQRAMRRIGLDLGLEGLHPHQMRRTYAVMFLRAHKGDPEALMKLTEHMQWANMTTAMQYVDHVRGAELDRVAETMFDGRGGTP